jgi:hypothetical protein
VGQDVLNVQGSKSHSGTPPFVGLLWTSDQPVTETSEIFKLQKKIARIFTNLNREDGEGIDFTQNICMLIQECTNSAEM